MSFKILYVTATIQESESLKQIKDIKTAFGKFLFGESEIELLVAGIGTMSTAWSLTQWISANEKPDLAINSGIAGSYKEEFPVGSVIMPVSDCFADAGIEDGNRFLTLQESGLVSSDEFPFVKGYIHADAGYVGHLKNILYPAKAITVNTATGSDVTRRKLQDKFDPDIETMEGAAFYYICAREKIPFISLRAISNMVEPRNREKWNIPLALNNLTIKLEEVFKTLNE